MTAPATRGTKGLHSGIGIGDLGIEDLEIWDLGIGDLEFGPNQRSPKSRIRKFVIPNTSWASCSVVLAVIGTAGF